MKHINSHCITHHQQFYVVFIYEKKNYNTNKMSKNSINKNKTTQILQILAADKQRKQDLKFLDEQAAERELERDEFTKEIEQLKSQLREKDKERHTYERIAKEVRFDKHQFFISSINLNTSTRKFKINGIARSVQPVNMF